MEVLRKFFLETSKRFPEFNSAKRVFLYERSNLLKNIQKNKIKNNNIKWIKNFKEIKKGPIIFFGNEFFDAILLNNLNVLKKLYEKYYILDSDYKIRETFKIANKEDEKDINSYKVFKKLKFIEFPKSGLEEP